MGLVRRTEEGYELEPPLFFPRVYDDIECPSLVVLEGSFYLIGSIREDMEVLYWWSQSFRGEYRSFRPNILLPKGNYAARTMQDGRHVLVFNFYIDGLNVETGTRTLPPPKQLRRDSQGRLELVSYYRWEEKKRGSRALEQEHFRPHLENPTADSGGEGNSMRFFSRCGYEVFTAPEDGGAWIWEGELRVIQQGRCGFVFGIDDQLNGYFVAIDATHGLASIKAWGVVPSASFRTTFTRISSSRLSHQSGRVPCLPSDPMGQLHRALPGRGGAPDPGGRAVQGANPRHLCGERRGGAVDCGRPFSGAAGLRSGLKEAGSSMEKVLKVGRAVTYSISAKERMFGPAATATCCSPSNT